MLFFLFFVKFYWLILYHFAYFKNSSILEFKSFKRNKEGKSSENVIVRETFNAMLLNASNFIDEILHFIVRKQNKSL